MPQLLFAGFPEGAIRVGSILSILKKEGRVTYFVGADNYFSHAAGGEMKVADFYRFENGGRSAWILFQKDSFSCLLSYS